LDLSDYDSVKVTYQLKDADGNDVSETDAGYGKVALVPSGKLNGYDSGITGWMAEGARAAGTKEISLASAETADVATVAGFNFQVGSTAADKYYVISSVVFFKDTGLQMDLADSGIVGYCNTGSDTVEAESSADGIVFGDKINMMYVDFSKYLTDKNIDISDYAGISVTYQLKDADGNDVSETEAGYGKVAVVPTGKLNGYDSGVVTGWLGDGERAAGTKEVSFATAEAADLATVAGFNFQVGSTAEGAHYVITAIKLIGK
jgi:hypothetical protein